MPEGDTLFRTAERLRALLVGKTILRAGSSVPTVDPTLLEDREVKSVEPYGKNLFVYLEPNLVLYTHLRMTGSWHIYKIGEPWLKPVKYAKVVLEIEGALAICFSAPVVELMSAHQARKKASFRDLGPDVLAANFDRKEACRRIRKRNDKALGEVLLNQRALAGIGNIYKSETLFICGADPFAPVQSYSDQELDSIVNKAEGLMTINRSRNRRTTPWSIGKENYWVYMRRGKPCFHCKTPIQMRRQGEDARSTYWCPSCQPSRLEGV